MLHSRREPPGEGETPRPRRELRCERVTSRHRSRPTDEHREHRRAPSSHEHHEERAAASPSRNSRRTGVQEWTERGSLAESLRRFTAQRPAAEWTDALWRFASHRNATPPRPAQAKLPAPKRSIAASLRSPVAHEPVPQRHPALTPIRPSAHPRLGAPHLQPSAAQPATARPWPNRSRVHVAAALLRTQT